MDFCFEIPIVISDLLNSNGNNYFVKNVYDANDLTDLLKGKTFIDKDIIFKF